MCCPSQIYNMPSSVEPIVELEWIDQMKKYKNTNNIQNQCLLVLPTKLSNYLYLALLKQSSSSLKEENTIR